MAAKWWLVLRDYWPEEPSASESNVALWLASSIIHTRRHRGDQSSPQRAEGSVCVSLKCLHRVKCQKNENLLSFLLTHRSSEEDYIAPTMSYQEI